MRRNLYPSIFVSSANEAGEILRREEVKTPVYTTTKTSAAKKHREHTEPLAECFYCQTTNGNLTLEQEKNIVETVNKLVMEKKK